MYILVATKCQDLASNFILGLVNTLTNFLASSWSSAKLGLSEVGTNVLSDLEDGWIAASGRDLLELNIIYV